MHIHTNRHDYIAGHGQGVAIRDASALEGELSFELARGDRKREGDRKKTTETQQQITGKIHDGVVFSLPLLSCVRNSDEQRTSLSSTIEECKPINQRERLSFWVWNLALDPRSKP